MKAVSRRERPIIHVTAGMRKQGSSGEDVVSACGHPSMETGLTFQIF